MRIGPLECLVAAAVGFAASAGCNSPGWSRGAASPASPPGVAGDSPGQPKSSNKDEYEGWLFRKLTGKGAAGGQTQADSQGLPGQALPSNLQEETTTPKPSGWERLSGDNVKKEWKKLIGRGPNENVARQAFLEGEDLFRQKKYKEAAEKYKIVSDRWPDSNLDEDALFMLGECQFFTDEYSHANDTYGTLLKRYENSRHLDRAVARRFAVARYWEEANRAEPHYPVTPNLTDKTRPWFDTKGNARATYERVWLDDPTGPLADDSVMAVANAYYLDGRYEDADEYFSRLRRDFAKSEHQVPAGLLSLDSKLRKYQGSRYDEKPLKEADELAGQLLVQFPTQLGAERDRLLRTRQELRAQTAKRDWDMAEYYSKTQHFGAARYYYQVVIKEHPGTSFAQQAAQRLDEIKGKPDEPPDYFTWLENLFPGKKKR
ncbi:MAG: tetratricopeptide repeat protein [Pirellulales bacterium]